MNHKDFAIELAYKAGTIMRKNFSIGMQKKWKADGTPVTETDITINELVLKAISSAYPDYGVLAEEKSNFSKQEYVWVCDPLDGTAAFSQGYPTFCFSLALLKNSESLLGVIYDPILDRLVYGEKGKGAFLNDKKIKVSSINTFSNKAFINTETDTKYLNLRNRLMEYECYVTTFYSCLYGCLLVACGEFVAEVYEYTNPWDAAAAKIIIEEAGGKVTDITGHEQRYDEQINGIIASNGLIHGQLVKLCEKLSV